MAFELKNVVPWGRNFDEYIKMFNLSETDLNKKIIGFGDGPASFNYEMYCKNKHIVSVDPIYQFLSSEIKQQIEDTKSTVIEQLKSNSDKFVWTNFKNTDELVQTRISAMDLFLSDYELGKKQGRYVTAELPAKLEFEDRSFELGLSSHFLLLYSNLGFDFHIQAIQEMMRLCEEVRIFPIVNLDSQKTDLLHNIIDVLTLKFTINIKLVNYEFQKGGNEMLIIKNE